MAMDAATLWFLIGLALVALEFAAPGIILVFFGAGAWLVALTSWLGWTTSTGSRLLVFAISSVVFLVSFRRGIQARFSGHVSDIHDPQVNLDEFSGKRVEVLEDIDPNGVGGRVEFKGADWSARSQTALKKGESAVIESVDGLCLIVRAGEEGTR